MIPPRFIVREVMARWVSLLLLAILCFVALKAWLPVHHRKYSQDHIYIEPGYKK